MDTLKIAYADFWPEWDQENFIQPILEKHFNVVEDRRNPDVLFHSIFGGMRETPKYKCKKILYLGENWRPERFGSDYSISFDPHSETNYRLPLWQVYLFLKPELKESLFNRIQHTEFERFCSFTVSNPSNTARTNFFDKLHSWKRVNSYGKVRTNDLGLQQLSAGKYWRDAKDKFFTDHPHKFMITYENSSYPGYCTEKLMDSFLAGSLPLYWGDIKVKEDWNEKAFINVADFGTHIFDLIHLLDGDTEKFNEIYSQPVFTDEQKERHLENMRVFEEWAINSIKK
jgi:hypothetical protein